MQTVHDHYEKRGRKGYLFLIGDEMGYPTVRPEVVQGVLGETIQDAIPFEVILKEAQERYHVFFIIPNMTSHYGDPKLEKWWESRLGQQHVLRLEDPNKVCELIASAVAICEEHIGLDDLKSDGIVDTDTANALVRLADVVKGGAIARVAASNLPETVGVGGEIERL